MSTTEVPSPSDSVPQGREPYHRLACPEANAIYAGHNSGSAFQRSMVAIYQRAREAERTRDARTDNGVRRNRKWNETSKMFGANQAALMRMFPKLTFWEDANGFYTKVHGTYVYLNLNSQFEDTVMPDGAICQDNGLTVMAKAILAAYAKRKNPDTDVFFFDIDPVALQ